MNLARKLLGFTGKQQLKWEGTADETTFRLVVDSGMIQIQERSPLGAQEPGYVFTVLNDDNIPVETFTGEHTEGGKSLLRNLYEAARDSALQPHQLLDRIDVEITRLAEARKRP